MEESLQIFLEKWKFACKLRWKNGKDYIYHRALSNIMDCDEYDIPEALVFNNDNLSVDGQITYVPVYMVMCLEKEMPAAQTYSINLEGLE